MIGITVRLARVWGVSPTHLRDLSLDELAEMGAVLVEEDRARRR